MTALGDAAPTHFGTDAFTDDVAAKCNLYNYGVSECNTPEKIRYGVSLSYRNLSEMVRTRIRKQMEADGQTKNPESYSFVMLDQPTCDDAFHAFINKTPVKYLNEDNRIEATAKVDEWYTKSLGFTDIEFSETENDLKKAIDSNIGVIHAYADTDMVLLNNDVQIIQSIFRQEAAVGKDVMIDIKPPWNVATPYFGTELQDYVDSDFKLTTIHDQLYFLYNSGEISTAALNFALSANPRRDLMPLTVTQHQLGMRYLRERRLLGIDSDVNNPDFKWENHTEGLNYAGLHEVFERRIGHNEDGLSCIVRGDDIYNPTDTDPEIAAFKRIMNRVNTVTYRGKLAGQTYNAAITDWQTAQLIANFVYPNIRIIDESPTRAFGVSSIQINTLASGPLTLLVHPWMPSKSEESCMMFMDTQMEAMRIGWKDIMQEVPNTTRNSKRFVITAAETFIDKTDADPARHHTLMGALWNVSHPNYMDAGVIL